LRTWNKAFLLFKDKLEVRSNYFQYIKAKIEGYAVIRTTQENFKNAINDIFENIEDKKLREKVVNTGIKSLKGYNAYKYQEKGFLPFIETKCNDREGLIKTVEILNNKIKEAKEYIETLRTFLNKNLPLQPYKELLKYQEDKIRGEINICKIHVGVFILYGDFINDAEKLKINSWEDVRVEIIDEDIEAIKEAGI
jgi:hypothetical protein